MPRIRTSIIALCIICVAILRPVALKGQDTYTLYTACAQAFNEADTTGALRACGSALEAMYQATDKDSLLDVTRFYYAVSLEMNLQIPAARDSMQALSDDIFTEQGCSDDYITVQDMLVLYHGILHDPKEKIKSINNVIACAESLYGDSIEYLVSYYYLAGEEYLLTGDYAASIRFFEKAKALHKKIYGAPDVFYARLLVEMSSPYFSIGQLNRSIEADEEALAVLDALGDSSYDIRADAYQLLAWAHLQRDSVELALSYVQKQIDATEHLDKQIKANILVGAALFIINFDIDNGTTIAKENNFVAVLNEALRIYDSLPPDPIFINNVYLALGNYYSHEGITDSVLHYYNRSADLLASVYGRSNTIYFNALSTLAVYYAEAGKIDKAQESFDALDSLSRSFLQSNFLFLSESEQETFLSSFENYQLLRYNFYTTQPTMSDLAGEAAFDGALFMKGLLLQNITTLRNRVYTEGSEQAKKDFDAWTAIKQTLAGLIIANDPRSKELEEKAANLEKDLLRSGFSLTSGKQMVTWRDVQQVLHPDTAVIELIRCYQDGTEIYFASILGSGSQHPALVRLCTADDLYTVFARHTGESEAAYVGRMYGTYDLDFPEDSIYFNGRRLYQLLWAPMEPVIGNAKHIYVSADGLLHQIAWHAIPDTDGQPVMVRRSVNYVNSARDLLTDAPETFPATILLAGGLSYATAQAKNIWSYLPGTLTEIQEINKLATENKIAVTMLSGVDATEQKLTGLVEGRSVLHLATHAFAFSETGNDMQMPGRFFAGASDPLLRTGLVLSQGDAAWMGLAAPGSTDNILTAYEIAGSNLTATSLVVLSACETSLGDVRGSEGVYGLQRAFRMAGAGTLIISLWKVPDAYTSELMHLFYEALFSGVPAEEALLMAQRTMQKKSGVYYWAAFKLVI